MEPSALNSKGITPRSKGSSFVRLLRSHGMENFTISFVTDYHPDHPEGKRFVYLEGLDVLSEKKKKQVLETSKRRERRLLRRLKEMGRELPT